MSAAECRRVKAVDFPQLRRLKALEEDMRFYHPALATVAAGASSESFAQAVSSAGVEPSEVSWSLD